MASRRRGHRRTAVPGFRPSESRWRRPREPSALAALLHRAARVGRSRFRDGERSAAASFARVHRVRAKSACSSASTSLRTCCSQPNYGVPQTRRRAIVVGVSRARASCPSDALPAPAVPLGGREWRTFRWAVNNPTPLAPSPTVGTGTAPGTQRATSVERYKTIPNEGEGRFELAARRPDITPACWLNKRTGTTDVFGRLWWDKPAYTIRTEFFKPEKGRYLHPPSTGRSRFARRRDA